jgi:hypothetical protein
VLAEGARERGRLRAVSLLGPASVRVDVVHVACPEAALRERGGHRARVLGAGGVKMMKVERVGRLREADDLAVHRGAAGARSLHLLEHHDRASLAHDDARALDVERPERALGLGGVLADLLERREAGDGGLGEGGLEAARDDHVGVAAADGAVGRADRVRPARGVVDDRLGVAVDAVQDRELADRRRGDPRDRHVRAHEGGTLLVQLDQVVEEVAQAAVVRGHHEADARGVLVRELEAGAGERFRAGGEGEVGVAVRADRDLVLQVARRVEVLDLADDLHGQVGVVDEAGPSQARAPGARRRLELLEPDAYGRDDADARHRHASLHGRCPRSPAQRSSRPTTTEELIPPKPLALPIATWTFASRASLGT